MGYKNKTKKEYQSEWRKRNYDRLREYQKKYHIENRKKDNERSRKYVASNREIIRETQRKYKRKNNEKVKRQQIEHKLQVKKEILRYYSSGPDPRCDCCGETELEFLTIDHINGGGNHHRRTEPGAHNIYRWLKNHGYPSGYRVLCMNCNFATRFDNQCPHQKRS